MNQFHIVSSVWYTPTVGQRKELRSLPLEAPLSLRPPQSDRELRLNCISNNYQKMLSLNFYQQPSLKLAKDLIGKMLVRNDDGKLMKAMIVETEAYIGENDSACHACKGRTARTDIMFQRAGHSYVYFIYGMHYMLNVVSETEGFPAAILIRAAEPVEGIACMQQNRKVETTRLCNGPAKLCKSLNITKAQNKLDLCNNSELWLENYLTIDTKQIQSGPRVVIAYASKEDIDKPWRFFLKNNPHISK